MEAIKNLLIERLGNSGFIESNTLNSEGRIKTEFDFLINESLFNIKKNSKYILNKKNSEGQDDVLVDTNVSTIGLWLDNLLKKPL